MALSIAPVAAHIFPLAATLSKKSITFRLRCSVALFQFGASPPKPRLIVEPPIMVVGQFE